MVRHCFVCKKLDYLNANLTFHRIPGDVDIRRTWFSILNLPADAELAVTKHSLICSAHFLDADFEYKGAKNRKFLKRGAIPVPPEVESTVEGTPPKRQKSVKHLTLNLLEKTCDDEAGPSSETALKSTSSSTLTASECGDLNVEEPLMEQEPPEFKDSSESLGVKSLPSSSTMTASESEQQTQLGSKAASSISHVHKQEYMASQSLKRKRRTAENVSSSDFSTPRKAKRHYRLMKNKLKVQHGKIRILQQSVRRLRAKVTSLQSLVTVLKEKCLITENAESTIMSTLPPSAADIFSRMLKGPTKQKYSPVLRSFALTLSFYSPRAYNFVRQTFNRSLPHLNTLSKWYQSVDGSPGWTKEAVNALKIKAQEAEAMGKAVVCNLVLDEMSIRKQVEWTGKKFTGYIDIGTNIAADTLPEAKEALVFMLVNVNGCWKLPVGYFLLNGLCASEKASLVKSCLQFVHESGVKVLSLTFDGAPTNFQMAQNLGADFKDANSLVTWFKHPVTEENVFIFPDACHMIKLVRNCLAAYQLIIDGDGGKIEWKFLQKLVNLQSEEGLRAGTKIRSRHISFANEKMKVKIATQTLSKSVSDALLYLKETSTEFKDAAATAKFIRIFNDIFDILNSKNRLAKYFYKKPLSQITRNDFFEYLAEIKTYILKLSVNGETILKSGRKTGFLGFLICIESLVKYYEQNVEDRNFLKYLLTYKLSQDHLELFFGAIRSKGGFNNNPTARQFEAAYKRLIVHHEIRSGDTGNVINLDSTSILHCSSRSITTDASGEDTQQTEKYIAFEEELTKNMDKFDFTASVAWNLTDYVLDVVSYIAGFVVKSMKNIITCVQCLHLLESDTALSKLQQQKEYRQLTKASQMVINLCQHAEKYFRFFHKTTGVFNKNIRNLSQVLIINTMRNLPSSILDSFGDHLYDDDAFDNHSHKLMKLILQKYFQLRIHHEANKGLEKTVKVRSRLTKTILFKNQ